jgi:glycosyltransferase involved in cell wall biosynthesis
MQKHILILVQGLEKGGRTKRIAETAQGLIESGYQLTVASMTPIPEWVKLQHQQVQLQELPRQPKLDLGYVLTLAKFIKANKIALLHAHCEASYFYGGLAAQLVGIPAVGTYHRSELKYFQPTLKNRLNTWLLSKVVAISNDRMGLLQRNLKVPVSKLALIHGGVDLHNYRAYAPHEITELRRKLVVGERRVFLSVGHLGEIKGHDYTLQALPTVIQQFPDVLLIIAGDGATDDYARLQALIARLQLQEHVKLLGQTSNVIEWLNVCEVFVQPSVEEGFGLVFVEAGACSKPVVATAVGGIKDIIVDQQTGLLVAPRDATGLAQALLTLLSRSDLRQRMGQAAQQRVSTSFTLAAMVNKYTQLFSQLIR